MQHDRLEAHRLTVEASIRDVVVRWGVCHHLIDRGLRFIAVDDRLLFLTFFLLTRITLGLEVILFESRLRGEFDATIAAVFVDKVG